MLRCTKISERVVEGLHRPSSGNANGPRAGKAEALAQPQHCFKALDGAPGRVEGLKAAHPRYRPLDPEVVALDPLLQVLGHVMDRGARQKAVFFGRHECRWC